MPPEHEDDRPEVLRGREELEQEKQELEEAVRGHFAPGLSMATYEQHISHPLGHLCCTAGFWALWKEHCDLIHEAYPR